MNYNAHIKVQRPDPYPVKLEMTAHMARELMKACKTANIKFPNSEFSVTLGWLRSALNEFGLRESGELDTITKATPLRPI